MNKTMISVATALFATTALAQTPSPAPAAQPAPTKPVAPAPVKAVLTKPTAPAIIKPGTQVALEPKTTTAPSAPSAPTAPPLPQAAPEVEAMYKARKGAWKCKGAMMTPDGGQAPMVAGMTVRLDLGKHWLVSNFAQKGRGGLVFTAYQTYSIATKNWTQVYVDNMGGYEVSTAPASMTNKMQWDGESPMNGVMVKMRHHEEVVSAKEIRHAGEMSMDGKTWSKAYEMVCKK